MSDFPVFLSAVSKEFGSARTALGDDLRAKDIAHRIQESFLHDRNAGTLLHKLKNYIESCGTVVCLMGRCSGAGFPQPDEAAEFRDFLPPGFEQASYTQWEFLFAHRMRRRCLVYIASLAFQPDPGAPQRFRRDDALNGRIWLVYAEFNRYFGQRQWMT